MDINLTKFTSPDKVMGELETRMMEETGEKPNGFNIGRFIMGILFIVLFWFVLSYVIQWAWNNSMPSIFPNVQPMTQMNALALVFLVQLLRSRMRM